jgi:GNAT superfamily N-acetyltransferase
MNRIRYQYGNNLNLDQVIELYNASTLGERRPVDDRQVMADMFRHANLVVTAWDGDLLIGIARTLTDFSYVGYLSDLAVKLSYQRKGIGIQLVQKTREKMGPRSMLVLLAAPKAVEYYPKIGFTKHNSAWTLKAQDPFSVRHPRKGARGAI